MSRTLTITLQRQGMPANLGVAPVAELDGVEVARCYGTHVMPLLADRPSELTCRLGLTRGSRASTTIPAGPGDVSLEYTVPAIRGLRGQLGPVGTTGAAGGKAVVPAVVLAAPTVG
ncbi:hypothetical protein [Pseudactinotalea terrae]|uniref:hypothetical protein n=1 Tax=Pseudactinotalea terrae TaxID=1743262 RepID=UPI0012E28C66|nr:hypothetical protein [Pseudactinotalea terrae]